MTSPKPQRSSVAARSGGFSLPLVVVLCIVCFFAGRFITLPGELPQLSNSGVSDQGWVRTSCGGRRRRRRPCLRLVLPLACSLRVRPQLARLPASVSCSPR